MKLCMEIQLNFTVNLESEHKNEVFQEMGDGTDWFICKVLLACLWDVLVLSPEGTQVRLKEFSPFFSGCTGNFFKNT